MSPCYKIEDKRQKPCFGQDLISHAFANSTSSKVTDYKIARGGGSNFGLMTHLFKAGSPDLRRLQITTLHAGGVAFWAKFSIL